MDSSRWSPLLRLDGDFLQRDFPPPLCRGASCRWTSLACTLQCDSLLVERRPLLSTQSTPSVLSTTPSMWTDLTMWFGDSFFSDQQTTCQKSVRTHYAWKRCRMALQSRPIEKIMTSFMFVCEITQWEHHVGAVSANTNFLHDAFER